MYMSMMKMRTRTYLWLAFFLAFYFISQAIAQTYKKQTRTEVSKPEVKLDQLAALNFLLSQESSEIEIEAEEGEVLISGKNHYLDGSPAPEGGGPAIRLSGPSSILEIEHVSLEGVPAQIEYNYSYNLDTETLFFFLRRNADLEYTADTTLQDISIGSPDDYQIVYVNDSKLTLSSNFSGYGILYIEDDSHPEEEPILELLENASWYGLIVVNQLAEGKTSKILLQGSSSSSGPGTFAILGIDSVNIGNNLEIESGNVGVYSSQGSLLIGNNAEIEGSLMANTIILGNNVEVEGDIHYNYFSHGSHLELEGEEITPLTFPFVELPDFPSFEPGTQNISLGHNQTYYLDAGSYNNITLGNNSKLYLTGGEYILRNLTLGNNSKIKYLSASTIKVKGKVLMGNNAEIEPEGEELDSNNCIFYIEGSGYSSNTNVFSLGNNSEISSNIYAPNSTITIANNSEYKGAIIARKVTSGNNLSSSIELNSAFEQSSEEVKIYGSLLLIGSNFFIPNEGTRAKVYYSEETLQDVNQRLESIVIKNWREIE